MLQEVRSKKDFFFISVTSSNAREAYTRILEEWSVMHTGGYPGISSHRANQGRKAEGTYRSAMSIGWPQICR